MIYKNLHLVTFRVSPGRHEIYCGHPRLCVCLSLSVCLSVAACLHYCTDPDVTWGSGRGCPLDVHYWADLQSGHGLRCYGEREMLASTCLYSPSLLSLLEEFVIAIIIVCLCSMTSVTCHLQHSSMSQEDCMFLRFLHFIQPGIERVQACTR